MPIRGDALAMARSWLEALSSDGADLHRDARGRPKLPAGSGDIGWSHSAGRLLMAYASHGSIGVDIESSARHAKVLPIARRYFADDEVAALSAHGDEHRQRAFLRLWCAKEAVLKAAGLGIAFGLHRVSFDLSGDAPRMTRCDAALGDIDTWMIRELEPEPGYIAVLATVP